MKFVQSGLCAALWACAAVGANASLVTNGSFEANQVSHWTIFSAGIDGWSTGSAGIEIQPTGTLGGVSAYDGNQYVELDTTRNSFMYQDIATTLNGIYSLSFAYMARPDNIGGSASNPIEVYWGGTKLATFSGKSKPGPWLEVNLDDLKGKAGFTRLEFRAVGTSDGYGGLIDGVAVAAVPEPESYAMLLAGLGLMATIARRRNRR
ncbi:PEP-CTERM sorting domain-containing protein [Chitinimonas arctica]|uniref:PEP-CTERM sorting domain-containing protein n=1 Tax=Chitinimonas arctica TaxID=2594795 RepID=A0A516SHZ4_9NEIS|nr:PEP-CTERM sorting domain-containing protein [Chitinimonas arctica]QDQ27782.1 PEP-CTERM sorting domain-containing protein [Chitinimonas arctica]